MRSIGVDATKGLLYEGDNAYGHGVWPSPVVTVAQLLSERDEEESMSDGVDLGVAPLVFREDAFEPVARLRRGRFYCRMPNSSQPQQWHVQPHPALPNEYRVGDRQASRLQKTLYTFYAWQAANHVHTGIRPSVVALGTGETSTLWRVVSIEKGLTGEELVTLKARNSMGVLPELDEASVPEADLSRVRRVLDDLADAAHRLAPGSVIDRARDACQWCIGVWLAERTGGNDQKLEDLGRLARRIPENYRVPRAIAEINARLHARVKPNEQERHLVRPVTEEDAEFALAAIGTLLRDLGWAR